MSRTKSLSELDGMTEEERLAIYNEKNYPSKNIRYHSANGGGTGALSPYPKSDPRSKAYYDQPVQKPNPQEKN